jgi:hypothetical protein
MQKRVMIVVNVPEDEADALRKAIGDAGGGKLGNYSTAAFRLGVRVVLFLMKKPTQLLAP